MKNLNYYTHAGRFHADETLGYVICFLAGICSNYVRLTDLENIPEDGIIADIGRVWLPSERKFDHHQDIYARHNGHPYATAGMIWHTYGEMAITRVLEIPDLDKVWEKGLIRKIWERVDRNFIQGVDANDADNSYEVEAADMMGPVTIMDLPSVIRALNHHDVNAPDQMFCFDHAVQLMLKLLRYHIKGAAKYFEYLDKFEEVADFLEDGKLIVLREPIPWISIVVDKYPEALFVIMPSNHPGNAFQMQAVPIHAGTRRVHMEIDAPDGWEYFVHQGRWIAGAPTEEDLIHLASFNIHELPF